MAYFQKFLVRSRRTLTLAALVGLLFAGTVEAWRVTNVETVGGAPLYQLGTFDDFPEAVNNCSLTHGCQFIFVSRVRAPKTCVIYTTQPDHPKASTPQYDISEDPKLNRIFQIVHGTVGPCLTGDCQGLHSVPKASSVIRSTTTEHEQTTSKLGQTTTTIRTTTSTPQILALWGEWTYASSCPIKCGQCDKVLRSRICPVENACAGSASEFIECGIKICLHPCAPCSQGCKKVKRIGESYEVCVNTTGTAADTLVTYYNVNSTFENRC